MERICGSCTACCKTHGVFELKKMGGEWCPHCKVGEGCKIYVNRPAECQHFKCSWLLGAGNDEHRPDRIEIVSEYREISGLGMSLWLFELTHQALRSRLAKRWTLNNLLKGNCVLHIPWIDKPKLYLSPRIKNFRSTFVFGENRIETEVVSFVESVAQLI